MLEIIYHGRRISDFKQMREFNVMHPGMGPFGLPAENAAKQNNLSPIKWTDQKYRNHEKAA